MGIEELPRNSEEGWEGDAGSADSTSTKAYLPAGGPPPTRCPRLQQPLGHCRGEQWLAVEAFGEEAPT